MSCVPVSYNSIGHWAVGQPRGHQVSVLNTSVALWSGGTTFTCLHPGSELHLTLPPRSKSVVLLIWKLSWITKTMEFAYLFLISIRKHLHIHHKMHSSALESAGGRTVFHFLWNSVYCSMVWPLKSVHKSVYYGVFSKTIKSFDVIPTLLGSLQKH